MKDLKRFALLGAVLMVIAVSLGALGAHFLEAKITVKQLASYQTGIRYQLIHALAIVSLALVKVGDLRLRKRALWCMLLGVICFSFSIYLLSLRDLLGITSWGKFLGPITPLGGLLFIAGWICVCVDVSKIRSVD